MRVEYAVDQVIGLGSGVLHLSPIAAVCSRSNIIQTLYNPFPAYACPWSESDDRHDRKRPCPHPQSFASACEATLSIAIIQPNGSPNFLFPSLSPLVEGQNLRSELPKPAPVYLYTHEIASGLKITLSTA